MDKLTYCEAARVISLHLNEFCDNSLSYPDMIAEAARRAAKEIEKLNTRPTCSTCKFLHENKKWDSGYECTNNKACNSGVGVAVLKTFGCIYHEKGE